VEWIGIVIKSDPRGLYKPSRLVDLIVDGEPRNTAFQLRETQTTLTWEVKPAAYVPLVVFSSFSSVYCSVITEKSIISIQPYEARTLIRRKKAEMVTIQGEAVFRFCSSRPGDKYGEYIFSMSPNRSEVLSLADFERVCAGFRVVISIVAEKDAKVCFILIAVVRGLTSGTFRLKVGDKSRSAWEGRTVSPRGHGQNVFFGPSTVPNPIKRSLDALHDLMDLIPSDSGVCLLAG
jgi:hypothetical protein